MYLEVIISFMERLVLTKGARIWTSHEGWLFLRQERNIPAEITRQKTTAIILVLFIFINLLFIHRATRVDAYKLTVFREYKSFNLSKSGERVEQRIKQTGSFHCCLQIPILLYTAHAHFPATRYPFPCLIRAAKVAA
jgi:hypothetical protein